MEDEVSTRSGSDGVLNDDYDPVATALGTDSITNVSKALSHT